MWFLLALLALNLPPVSPAAPNRQPQLASGDGTVALAFGSGESIWLARSTDDGVTLSAPAKVAELPKLLLGHHRGPRVAITSSTMLISAISSAPGDLVLWRSTDGGRTWSTPRAINDQPTSAREGLHAMAADKTGHVAIAWLDDRGGKGKKLYAAFSDDAGATWGPNVMLYASPSGSICECCHPSVAAMGDGRFAVMWRNSMDASRDLYVMQVRDGSRIGGMERQGNTSWQLNACPMDGGGVAVREGRVASAFRREKDVYMMESGKPERRLGTGQDAAFGANQQGWYAIWSLAGGGIDMMLPNATEITHVSKSGAFPALMATPGGGMLAAWEDNGTIVTQRF
jgi:hypothetical protein